MKSPRSSGQTRAMRTEFRKALMPGELRSLCTFDRKVFPSDHFSPADWRGYEAWWLVVNQRKIGCCAFETHESGRYFAGTSFLSGAPRSIRFLSRVNCSVSIPSTGAAQVFIPVAR